MERNFVCSWRRPNCRSQVIDLSLSEMISWFMKLIIRFLNNSNLHAIISTSLIINLHWVKKIYFAVLEEIYNYVVPQWSAVLISRNHSITRLISFTKNRFKSEINSFCIPRNRFFQGCTHVRTVYTAHLEQVVDQLLDALVPFGAHLSKFTQPQAQVSKQNMAAILFSIREKTTFL